MVNIYGSEKEFISVYKSMLEDRLLELKLGNLADEEVKAMDLITKNEKQNLEKLKIRFGEAQLQPCGVILRDLQESKRTYIAISEQFKM